MRPVAIIVIIVFRFGPAMLHSRIGFDPQILALRLLPQRYQQNRVRQMPPRIL